MSPATVWSIVALALAVLGLGAALVGRVRTSATDRPARTASSGTMLIAFAVIVSTVPRLLGVRSDGILIAAAVLSFLLTLGSFLLLRRRMNHR